MLRGAKFSYIWLQSLKREENQKRKSYPWTIQTEQCCIYRFIKKLAYSPRRRMKSKTFWTQACIVKIRRSFQGLSSHGVVRPNLSLVRVLPLT